MMKGVGGENRKKKLITWGREMKEERRKLLDYRHIVNGYA